MPYVVTTRHPQGAPGVVLPYKSSHAASTKDDAAQFVFDLVEDRYPLSELPEAIALEIKQTPDTTDYTLPDGTAIRVKLISWAEVRGLGGLSPERPFTEAEVLAAFNTRQA